MDVQPIRFVKTNAINVLILFFSVILSSGAAMSAMPVFGIALLDRALTIYSFPLQKAQTHSNFDFGLKPFFSVVRPEVDYRVTNHLKRTLTDIELIELPGGLTRIYDGEGVCPERFTLNTQQSCILRFYVDKQRYVHSQNGGPMVCFRPPLGYCSRPSPGSQIDDAVARVPGPTEAQVTPNAQFGLHYDSLTMSIVGTPTQPGVYHFQIGATNAFATAAPKELEIDVSIDPTDTPVFKDNHTIAIAIAMPEQNYRLNLMDLIKPTPGFGVSNQISFRIDKNHEYPDWLSLDKDDATLLQGHVPFCDAGLERDITLIASSNTGGDSLPLTLKISVAYDPTQKPIIEKGIALTGVAGDVFRKDFRTNISDPSNDHNLNVILDKIEPAAPWLSMSSLTPTELNGVVPADAVGQDYQITLHATTAIGGSSEVMTLPLHIVIDKNLTPRFYLDNPQLPLFYVGQYYSHDFTTSRDVYPQYNDIPYTVELAEGYDNPTWVRIEDNQFIVDSVPENLKQIEQIFITIKNVPGGRSEVLSLDLFIMS